MKRLEEMHPLERAARRGATPPDLSKKIWEWAAENVRLDDTGAWKGQLWSWERAPFTCQPMEDYIDDSIQNLTCMAGSQVSKTQPFMCAIAWQIVHDPSGTLWVSSTEEVMKLFAKARMHPTLRRCEPVAEILSEMAPGDKGVLHIHFPNGLLSMTSSESDAQLQSMPYRRLILDEARKYKPENFHMVMKRTRTFTHSKMTVILSCPEEDNDHVHQAFKLGDQNEWHFPCIDPTCRKNIRMDFLQRDPETKAVVGGLLFDLGPDMRTGYDFDLNKIAKTVRYKCPHCGYEMRDETGNRRYINDRGLWIPQNHNALPSDKSYHWNAVLPIWVTWESIMKEYVNALKAKAYGDIHPLQEFYRETLGLPFTEGQELEADITTVKDAGYKKGENWPDEAYRFMTIDVQKDHFWYVIRAWAEDGRSRLVAEGGGHERMGVPRPCMTYGQLRDIQLSYRVQENHVAIDVSHWQNTIVRNICKFYNPAVDSTWLAFKGTAQTYFSHYLSNNERVRRNYSEETLIDAWISTEQEGDYRPVPFYLISDDSAKDMLASERASGRWTIASDASKEYMEQIDGEAFAEVDGKWQWVQVGNRGNHILDCEKMQVVEASMARLIGRERIEAETERTEKQLKAIEIS